MEHVDCKLDLLLALHQQTQPRSPAVEPSSTAGPPTAERQRSSSETGADDTERDTAGRRQRLGRAATVDESAVPPNDVCVDDAGYNNDCDAGR